MPRTAMVLLALACSTALAIAQTAKTLDVYVVDVEGGNAVLFVTPAGESVLIDTGNGGAGAARDAERIAAAARDAGLSKIDHLIITHFHNDHVGGLSELAKRVPITISEPGMKRIASVICRAPMALVSAFDCAELV